MVLLVIGSVLSISIATRFLFRLAPPLQKAHGRCTVHTLHYHKVHLVSELSSFPLQTPSRLCHHYLALVVYFHSLFPFLPLSPSLLFFFAPLSTLSAPTSSHYQTTSLLIPSLVCMHGRILWSLKSAIYLVHRYLLIPIFRNPKSQALSPGRTPIWSYIHSFIHPSIHR
ncbi:hypothetical protein F4809DRAFT_61460 [Biscogniauxia mediterranea]|nr:hypothetical protein F4809DRAFT_61460 [Biscogniauxia mediterranea]